MTSELKVGMKVIFDIDRAYLETHSQHSQFQGKTGQIIGLDSDIIKISLDLPVRTAAGETYKAYVYRRSPWQNIFKIQDNVNPLGIEDLI